MVPAYWTRDPEGKIRYIRVMSDLLVPERDLSVARRAERREGYVRDARAPGTQAVYQRHWGYFVTWCQRHRVEPGVHVSAPLRSPVSPQTVADYLVDLADERKAHSTLQGALAAIAARHHQEGLPTPTAHPYVREILSGARRRGAREGRGRGKSEPLLPPELRRFVATLDDGLRGQRDLALLTVGFAGGFRRSELVRIDVGDLRWGKDSVTIRLRWSKADQEGEGHERRLVNGQHLELCPVRSLRAWLGSSGIQSGPVFRGVDRWGNVSRSALSACRVDEIVREYVKLAMDAFPETFQGGHYSAHSLRSGLITAALLAGKQVQDVQAHVGHASVQTTLGYARAAAVRTSTVTSGIGI